LTSIGQYQFTGIKYMRLLVLGATGKTGQRIVEQALDRGHSVTAFVRDAKKIRTTHDDLKIVAGNILNPASLEAAFAEPVDAVISALGIFHRKPRTDLSDGTLNVLQAMKRHGVLRLGIVSSLGAGDSRGQGNFVARNLQRMLLSHVIDDKDRQETYVQASDLDWTIVRPPQLTDHERIRQDLACWIGPTPKQPKLTWKTSRASVAAFMLDAMEQDLYITKAVNISEPK
jgi:putative NADH-flavin reductase